MDNNDEFLIGLIVGSEEDESNNIQGKAVKEIVRDNFLENKSNGLMKNFKFGGSDKPGAFAHVHNSTCNHKEISSFEEFNSISTDSDDESILSRDDEYLEQLFCSEEKGYILFLLLLLLLLLLLFFTQIKFYFKKMSVIMILLEGRLKISMKSSMNHMCAKENIKF